MIVAVAGSGADACALPGRGGVRRAGGRAHLLGALRRGRADDPLPADVGARPLTLLEDADPLLRAPGARRDLRPARQRALRQASGRSRVRAKRAGRVRRGGARRCRGRASGRRLMVRHGRVAHPCRRAPRSGQRPRLHRAGASGRRAGGCRVSVRGGARHGRGLGKGESPLLAARLARLRRVLRFEDVHGAALDEADRGLRRLGARDGCRDPARQLSRLGHQGARPGDDGRALCASPVPGSRDPRNRGRARRARARSRFRV